jgi:hypothetical protein
LGKFLEFVPDTGKNRIGEVNGYSTLPLIGYMKEEKGIINSCDVQRREFLKKSMHLAYATPVIMSVLVERASAGNSNVANKNPNCNDPNFACLNQQACPGDCPNP